MSRDSLLALDRERTAIERELASILEYLNAPGMPGLDGPLVDREGFPFANLDLYKIREMRQRFRVLNNDYSAVMHQVEEQLATYYGGNVTQVERPQARSEVTVAEVTTELERLRPFAYISEVTQGSPADVGGVMANDRVTKVGAVDAHNHSRLSALPEEVKSHLNRPLSFSILRRNELNEEVSLDLTVTPQPWAGPGILGCRFMPLDQT